MAYVPHTASERKEMLERLGIDGVQALFADIPPSARMTRDLNLPPGLSEWQVQDRMRRLAGRNRSVDDLVSFLGAGSYDRFIPAAVAHLASRGEFQTAYTPYQPELSQGTLAAIFEFQTMIASLTGMDAAQASLYDGASAAAEAALLAMAATGRPVIGLARTLHPDVRQVVSTYVKAKGGVVELMDHAEAPVRDGSELAAVIWPYPDVLGGLAQFPQAMERARAHGALGVCYADPVALALLKPPGDLGAEVVVGEGQPLGQSLQYGGPGFGFFAVKSKWVRRMPGRIVGATRDLKGRRGFVLTLQAREQHIRRDKATSNVCSNHSLNALKATIYLALLGPAGLRRIAQLSVNKAHYLQKRLAQIGLRRLSEEPFLFEFSVLVPGSVASLNRWLLSRGMLGGVDLGAWDPLWANGWQLAVTEKRTKEEMDRLVEEVQAWIESR